MPNKEKYSYITQADYESVAGPSWPPFSVFVEHNNVPDFVYLEINEMLSPQKKFSHPSFCILPFYGIEYPSNTFCCLVPSGSSREKVKNEMLTGIRPVECKKCWTLEDQGIKSDRLIKNETLDFYFDKNIQDLYNACLENKAETVHYKIDTNNVCNATCITCDGKSSSAWAKLEKENGRPDIKTWQKNENDVDKVIDYSTAKSILFRGGEPFMSKTNFYILEQLVKHSNTDCFISFVTNGSFELHNKQIDLIRKFSNVNFCFSIDGIGSVFEYLRYPLKFDQLERNIDFCKNNNIIPSVSYTVSNLNILYHQDTVSWFRKNNLEFLINPVYQPRYFRPAALPLSVKEKIRKNLSMEIFDLVSNHNTNDDKDFERFKIEIAKQDAWKNIQLKHYLPELADLLDQK